MSSEADVVCSSKHRSEMDGNYCIRMYLNGFDCSMTEYDWVVRFDSRLVLPSEFLQMSQTKAQRAVMKRKRSSEFHPLPLFRHHHLPARGTDFTWCTHSCHILSRIQQASWQSQIFFPLYYIYLFDFTGMTIEGEQVRVCTRCSLPRGLRDPAGSLFASFRCPVRSGEIPDIFQFSGSSALIHS